MLASTRTALACLVLVFIWIQVTLNVWLPARETDLLLMWSGTTEPTSWPQAEDLNTTHIQGNQGPLGDFVSLRSTTYKVTFIYLFKDRVVQAGLEQTVAQVSSKLAILFLNLQVAGSTSVYPTSGSFSYLKTFTVKRHHGKQASKSLCPTRFQGTHSRTLASQKAWLGSQQQVSLRNQQKEDKTNNACPGRKVSGHQEWFVKLCIYSLFPVLLTKLIEMTE